MRLSIFHARILFLSFPAILSILPAAVGQTGLNSLPEVEFSKLSQEDGQQFQGLGELEKWTGGIHSQGSLFILRNPEQKFSGNVLGHEIVHLVLHRFYADGIPCWLNEGIAQYISTSTRASYQRARGYISKPHSEAIAAEEVIPLATLVGLTRPPSDRVETFYDESERLVRFLVATAKPR